MTMSNQPSILAEVLALLPEDALPEGMTLEAAENVPHPPDHELACIIMGEDIV